MEKSHLQIFVEDFTQSILSVLKILLFSKFSIKLPKAQQKDCVILGNGPSLNDFINESSSFIENKALFCVNFFARTDYYEQVKPQYYIITSPEYFVGEKKEDWTEDRLKTFQLIAEKTSWPLEFNAPRLAKKSTAWREILSANKNITIRYFNNTPIEGFRSLKHWAFKNNLGMPRPHNVLIPSILLGINMNFENIYITGADHSWTKELFVTEGNEVLLSQKHFYDKQAESEAIGKNKNTPQPMYKGGSRDKRKLHEVLMKFVYSFKSYWELQEYAQSSNVKIHNITPGSFIDAFPRLNLNDHDK